MDVVISVEGLRKTYRDVTAVDGVSFEVGRGEIFGLLGPNGAGKTTTVECLQGLLHADTGRISVLGLDPRHQLRALRLHIGSQLQESALPDRIRVWEALDLFASHAPGSVDRASLLDDWGLAEKRTASFASLSGGQRQRLFVALALANDPELVFLDEMTTGLDPAARRVAWGLIEAIRERGTTVVLVTHFMDEAERLCDRLVVVDRGRIVDLGSPQELIERRGGPVLVRFTAHLDDAAFLEAVEGVERVERRGSTVEVEGSGPVLARVAAALVARGIEPSDLRVERTPLRTSSSASPVDGRPIDAGARQGVWVEAKLFAREPITVVFTLGLPLVLLFVLGGVFGNQPDPDVYRGVGPMDYYIPAYVALVAASLGLVTLPTHLAGYRDRGVLRRFEASSIPLSSVFGAQVIVTVTTALAGSILVIAAAAPAYDVHAPQALPAVFAAFLLTALAFASIGIFLGVAFPTARAAQGAGILLWFVMLIVGGAGPPPEVLSDAMRAVGNASPLSHTITLIQDPWLGLGWNLGETLIVLTYLGGAAALAALALRLRSAH